MLVFDSTGTRYEDSVSFEDFSIICYMNIDSKV